MRTFAGLIGGLVLGTAAYADRTDGAGGRRLPTPEDASRVKRIDQLALSPDGRRLVYRVSGLNDAGDERRSTFWSVDLVRRAPPVPFRSEAGDSDIAWSPDGTTIAFLRAVDGVAQLHVRSPDAEHACPLTSLAGGVGSFLWSPDGRRLAFTSVTLDDGTAPPPPPPGVRIFTYADYRAGNDYVDHDSVERIWTVDVDPACAPRQPRRLTGGTVSGTLSFWAKDSGRIYYTTDDTPEAYYGGGRSTLRSVAVSDGSQRVVRALKVPGSDEDLGSAPRFVLSPDGRQVAFTAGDPAAPAEFAQDDVFVMDLATGVTRNLTSGYDREVGEDLAWAGDDRLVAINNDRGNANLVRIDAQRGTVTPIWADRHEVRSFVLSRTGRMVALRSDFVTPPELYDVDGRGKARAITAVNRSLRDELTLLAPEDVNYRGPGGETIHGFLHRPPGFDARRRYPMIVLAHGGPYSAWGSGYDGTIQAIAAAGYLVFCPNPRGSASYGQAFATSLQGHTPGREYDDIMAGVDHLLDRPYVDAQRLGISGASAGGILTDWAITHTDRFAAAVSVSDIADFGAYWFIGDQPTLTRKPGDPAPWLDPKDRELSPITHGLNVRTPTLFIGGDRDYRTPMAAGGEVMFRLLKYLRVPTALVQFEGAGHAISRTADPRHPALSTHYLIRWMDRYLKGVPAPEFDLPRSATVAPAVPEARPAPEAHE